MSEISWILTLISVILLFVFSSISGRGAFENASNNKTYWKIMKMLLKSNKGSGNLPSLQNIINDKTYVFLSGFHW
jgi:hypothetical protein